MKAKNREKLSVVQGVLGALLGVHNDNLCLSAVIKSAAEVVIEVLNDEKTEESEEQQCKE